jgi:hypothetical protein
MAFDPQAQSLAIECLREALNKVREKAANVGVCGFSPSNALYPTLKEQLRGHTFLTRIETVAWPSDPEPAIDGRPPQPEIATL